MAITGYEIDQVMKTDDGDKSIPIYNAYNHHYFAWLNGADSDLVYYPDRTFHAPNPTHWAPKSKSESQTAYPTNIVFKENPGGEYRKSYHAYPCGYAQLIHSPSTFILEVSARLNETIKTKLTHPIPSPCKSTPTTETIASWQLM